MATQRRYSIEFKRQIVQEYQGGDTLHGLAKRHGISRNLVRIWAAKAEAGEFDDDLAAASILQEAEHAQDDEKHRVNDEQAAPPFAGRALF